MKKSVIVALILAIGAVAVALIGANAFKFKYVNQDAISVTGLGEKEFTSDLIVWQASLIQESSSLQEAYRLIEQNKTQVKEYLKSKGVADTSVVFQFININKLQNAQYDGNGRYIGSKFSGYQLTQTFRIESSEVEKIETLSREISELIAKGIQLEAFAPQYYYTKLESLKLELIAAATDDARLRAEQIATKSGAKLGKLNTGKMGVFQITAPNANEDFSWGGNFNTSSKQKKASITMKLDYHLKR